MIRDGADPDRALRERTARESYRFERKFLASGMLREEVRFLLQRHPAMFSEIHQRRWVNNIYLDSSDLVNVQHNVDGASQRRKIRIRWYGALLGRIATPVLECKAKRGHVGRKVANDLAPFDLGDTCRSSQLHETFEQSGLPEAMALELGLLHPTLMNRYARQYYQSANGRYRITVDTDMSFHALGSWKRFTQWTRLDSAIVIELKYAMDDDDGSAAITQFLPFRVCRNSKYIIGMQMVYPTVA